MQITTYAEFIDSTGTRQSIPASMGIEVRDCTPPPPPTPDTPRFIKQNSSGVQDLHAGLSVGATIVTTNHWAVSIAPDRPDVTIGADNPSEDVQYTVAFNKEVTGMQHVASGTVTIRNEGSTGVMEVYNVMVNIGPVNIMVPATCPGATNAATATAASAPPKGARFVLLVEAGATQACSFSYDMDDDPRAAALIRNGSLAFLAQAVVMTEGGNTVKNEGGRILDFATAVEHNGDDCRNGTIAHYAKGEWESAQGAAAAAGALMPLRVVAAEKGGEVLSEDVGLGGGVGLMLCESKNVELMATIGPYDPRKVPCGSYQVGDRVGGEGVRGYRGVGGGEGGYQGVGVYGLRSGGV